MVCTWKISYFRLQFNQMGSQLCKLQQFKTAKAVKVQADPYNGGFSHRQKLPRKQNMINKIPNMNQLINTTTVKFNRLNFIQQIQQIKSATMDREINISINATIHQSENPAYGNQHTVLLKCTGTKIYKSKLIYL